MARTPQHTLWGYNEAENAPPANFWQDMMNGPYSATSGEMGIGQRVGTLRCYTRPSAPGTWANFSDVARRKSTGSQPNEISAHDGGLVPLISSAPPIGRQPSGRWGYRAICDKADHASAGRHTGSYDAEIIAFAERFYKPFGAGGQFNWGAPVDPNAPGGQYGGRRSTYALWGGVPHEPNYVDAASYGYNDDGSDPGLVIRGRRYVAAQEHIFDLVEQVRIANSSPVRLYFFPIMAFEWATDFIVPTAYRHGRGLDQYYPQVSAAQHYPLSSFRPSFTDYPKWTAFLDAAKAADGDNVAIAFGEFAHGDIYDAQGNYLPGKSAEFIRNSAASLLSLRTPNGSPRIWTFPWFQSDGHRIDPVAKPQNFAAFHDGAVTLFTPPSR